MSDKKHIIILGILSILILLCFFLAYGYFTQKEKTPLEEPEQPKITEEIDSNAPTEIVPFEEGEPAKNEEVLESEF